MTSRYLDPEVPIQFARHYRVMLVPVSYGGDYAWDEARPATLVDLALAGVPLGKLSGPDISRDDEVAGNTVDPTCGDTSTVD